METISNINRRLRDIYGTFDVTEYPYFRVVYSDEEFENRLITHTKDGLALVKPTVILVSKYKQWVQNKYILEHLVEVPEENQAELAGKKFSYEPLWVFEDKNGNALPPIWGAIEHIIETIRENIEGAGKGPKYKDPYAGLTKEQFEEFEKVRLDGLQIELFGNETEIGDSLSQDSGVGYGIRQRNDKIN